MYKGKKASLIIPAYNEEFSVKKVILDFSRLGIFDEIIVVDNNSKDRTAAIARSTGKARIIKETKQGYGYALQRGLKVARGDILMMVECDNTNVPEDVRRLLKYFNKYDFVISTRTNKKYFLKGSNMFGIRKYANILMAKLIQFLFDGPKMSDPGSTLRLLNRELYEAIKNKLTVGGVNFQPELTILIMLNGFRIKEVPIYYRERIGDSKISGPLIGGLKTARKMLGIILYYRLSTWFPFLKNS